MATTTLPSIMVMRFLASFLIVLDVLAVLAVITDESILFAPHNVTVSTSSPTAASSPTLAPTVLVTSDSVWKLRAALIAAPTHGHLSLHGSVPQYCDAWFRSLARRWVEPLARTPRGDDDGALPSLACGLLRTGDVAKKEPAAVVALGRVVDISAGFGDDGLHFGPRMQIVLFCRLDSVGNATATGHAHRTAGASEAVLAVLWDVLRAGATGAKLASGIHAFVRAPGAPHHHGLVTATVPVRIPEHGQWPPPPPPRTDAAAVPRRRHGFS